MNRLRRNGRFTSSRTRTVAAFLCAPLPSVLILNLLWLEPSRIVPVFTLTATLAYGVTLFAAVPLFLLLRATKRGLTFRRVVSCAFLMLAVPLSALGIIAPMSLLPGAELRQAWEIVGFPMGIGLLTAIGAAVFWFIGAERDSVDRRLAEVGANEEG
jgi:hypothetical protein